MKTLRYLGLRQTAKVGQFDCLTLIIRQAIDRLMNDLIALFIFQFFADGVVELWLDRLVLNFEIIVET